MAVVSFDSKVPACSGQAVCMEALADEVAGDDRGGRNNAPAIGAEPRPPVRLLPMLIAQLSDVHVGGMRYRQELLHAALAEINAAAPDVVVVAGDLTDDGYPDQYPEAKRELEAIACEHIVFVPGNCGSGLPTTAASATAGCSTRADSTSKGPIR